MLTDRDVEFSSFEKLQRGRLVSRWSRYDVT